MYTCTYTYIDIDIDIDMDRYMLYIEKEITIL